MLDDEAAIPDAPKALPVQPEPSSAQMVALHARLARAERPFLIVGGVLSDQAVRDIPAFAEASGLPATLGFPRQDGLDQTSFCYAGDPERKSVRSGTRVSVRVDIGGRRINKKKK